MAKSFMDNNDIRAVDVVKSVPHDVAKRAKDILGIKGSVCSEGFG